LMPVKLAVSIQRPAALPGVFSTTGNRTVEPPQIIADDGINLLTVGHPPNCWKTDFRPSASAGLPSRSRRKSRWASRLLGF
jgi:hypothetical protein